MARAKKPRFSSWRSSTVTWTNETKTPTRASTMSGDASASGGDAFIYDPQPNLGEQRELRREYRALLANAQNTRRHLPESTIQELGDMVRIGDELYSKVKAPMDGLLDSRYLLNISDMGAEMTRTMRIDADAFDMDEYMQKVAHFIGGSTVAVSSRPDESADDMSQIFTGDTDTWNWDRLGLLAARHSRRAPVAEHLLGPLQVTPKHRKITRTSRLDADAEQVAPQRLDASAIIPSENETSRMVLDIARRLEECCGEDGINMFRFALNPDSFCDSVENLFYISFLIRDGKAAIIEDNEGDPILLLCEEPTEEDRQAGLTRRQLVLELDVPTWRELIALYNISTPMIPSREQLTALPSTEGWYS